MSLSLSILLAGLSVAVAILLAVLYARRSSAAGQELHGSFAMLGSQTGEQLRTLSAQLAERLAAVQQTLDQRIDALQRQWQEQNRAVGDRLRESREAMQSVSENLGKIFEASKRIEELAGNVSRLEDLLKPPKIRGTLGEAFLEQALRQVLPPGSYAVQHRFPDGEKVDAAIRVGGRWVPIDSKFPLENFRRALESEDEAERKRARRQFAADVRRHAEEIARKYIRPADGTYDFALMYVPAEAVYAEIASDSEEAALADYAVSLRVIPVSPRLLFAYLHTVAIGLRGLEIESRAREVMDRIAELTRQFGRVEEPFEKVGTHLGNAQKQYEEAAKFFGRFADRLRSVAAAGTLPAGEAAPALLPAEEGAEEAETR